ncbi:MAG: S1C family serine protease, partial [Pseudomonadota bacterium]
PVCSPRIRRRPLAALLMGMMLTLSLPGQAQVPDEPGPSAEESQQAGAAPAAVGGSVPLDSDEVADVARQVENSIVKIYTTAVTPDYFTPWRLMNPRQSTGSGALISEGRILTNAHVIADASYVQVQRHNDPQRYIAEVAFVSHDSDLALLTVSDEAFYEGMEPLELGELPEPHAEVNVFGFPVGGRTLSITRGILSRVEHQRYAHSGEYLLAGQIDAAINPGNSGGPVIVDGRIAGVVMQSAGGGRTEALGYFVPPDVIRHMLVDAADGNYAGFPDLGFRTQELESPAARDAFGLGEDQDGVLVVRVFENSPACGLLRENDVLVSIDGFNVANDGSIQLNEDIQTNYKYAIDQLQVGDSVELTVARDGVEKVLTLEASPPEGSYTLVRSEVFDQMPEYRVYGGIVFVPLNMNLIKRWGSEWARNAPVQFLGARQQWATPERREAVVALQVLSADVNLGYHELRNWIVGSVNGRTVRDFEHFNALIDANESEFVILRNDTGYQVVIDHNEAMESEEQILSRYRVPAASSDQASSQ